MRPRLRDIAEGSVLDPGVAEGRQTAAQPSGSKNSLLPAMISLKPPISSGKQQAIQRRQATAEQRQCQVPRPSSYPPVRWSPVRKPERSTSKQKREAKAFPSVSWLFLRGVKGGGGQRPSSESSAQDFTALARAGSAPSEVGSAQKARLPPSFAKQPADTRGACPPRKPL